MSQIRDIKLSDIELDAEKRLRALDHDWVKLLAVSIKDIGLRSPILLVEAGGKIRLMAGLHRLEAVRYLGWSTVPAIVSDDAVPQRRLVEVDENLMRRDLSELDRGAFLAEKQRLHVILNPDAARGKAGAAARWYARDDLSFASAAAEKMGVSKRTVERAIHRWENLRPEIRKLIQDTWIARSGACLDQLATDKGTLNQQRLIVGAMLRTEKPCSSVQQASLELKIVKPKPKKPHTESVKALAAAWKQADWSARFESLQKQIGKMPAAERKHLFAWLNEKYAHELSTASNR